MAKRHKKRHRVLFLTVIFVLVGGSICWYGRAQLAKRQSSTEVNNSTQQPTAGLDTTNLLAVPGNAYSIVASRPAASRPAIQARETVHQTNQLLNAGKVIQARNLANTFLRQKPLPPADPVVAELALQLGRQTILSPQVFNGDTLSYTYKVQAGDTLQRLGQLCKVSYQVLGRINGVDNPRRLRAGQTIKLLRGPFNAKVSTSKLLMYVYLQDTLVCQLRVGLGRKGNGTPSGMWLVEDRTKNPPYVDPDTNQYYSPNDPENPTGGYWIRLKGLSGQAVGKTGYGIHGTIEPDSIGKYSSKGCIRLARGDIALLFDMLCPGASKVRVVP